MYDKHTNGKILKSLIKIRRKIFSMFISINPLGGYTSKKCLSLICIDYNR